MAGLLAWKEGEGYDIHVLRGGLASKALDNALELDSSGSPPTFTSNFLATTGVTLNASTGSVTAAKHPATGPKFPDFSFLVTATQTVGTDTFETVIRIHVHDSIKKIWLTPASLTIYDGSDECRFTVLAQFGDDVVGDITEWPQLAYNVPPNPAGGTPLAVRNRGDIVRGPDGEEHEEPFGGRLHGHFTGMEGLDQSDVEVNLKLSVPPTDLTATAKVFVRQGWKELAEDPATKLKFVAGPYVPNENDAVSAKPNSVRSVFRSRPNILFISEGFTKNQEDDFRKKLVELVVKDLQTKDEHQPFKLLSPSINYWSVFIPSTEEGTGVLGDNAIFGKSPKQAASPLPLPDRPAPSQTQWTIANMVHDAGLPLPNDARLTTSQAWLAERKKLFNIPATVTVDAAALSDWNDLRQRTLLNERDSAFGMANYDRPRASGQGVMASEELLLNDPRRTSETSINLFVESLMLNGLLVGDTWEKLSGPDFGRVCFVCRSSRTGGTQIRAFFTVGTGQAQGASVVAAANGMDVKARPIDKSFMLTVFAAMVTHECGHALGLGDEYGGNIAFQGNPPTQGNLQAETLVAPTNPTTQLRTFDTGEIKWLWPRVSKAGFLAGPPDFQGQPDPPDFLVRLRKGQGKPFAKGDLVRIRQMPVKRLALDPFANILLKINLPVTSDTISVEYVNQSGRHIDLNLITSSMTLILVCTSIKPNTEFPLVATAIVNQIAGTNLPLNPPPGATSGAACVLGGGITQTPTNLPSLSKTPKVKQDIIGLYEGGGYHDCGIFRPAGRCRMDSGFIASTPFCHVCRYIIVDTVDPTKHGELDKLYPEVR